MLIARYVLLASLLLAIRPSCMVVLQISVAKNMVNAVDVSRLGRIKLREDKDDRSNS
jgi:hypothetical protein